MTINQEQFKSIQSQAELIIKHLESKKALEMAQQLTDQIRGLNDPLLFEQVQQLIFKLKWVACKIIRKDDDFFNLFKNSLLEGINIDETSETDILTYLVSERLALQFGVGLNKTLQELLRAIRENNQIIGNNFIAVKNEAKPVRPYIRHWLIDYLRNTESDEPGEIEESNYLFNNPNAQTLSGQDRTTLGQVLSFYDNFRYIAKEIAEAETENRIVETAKTNQVKETDKPLDANHQNYSSSENQNLSPLLPQQIPPSLSSQTPTQPLTPSTLQSASPYREKIEGKDMQGPLLTQKPGPKLDGNIVDLKEYRGNKN